MAEFIVTARKKSEDPVQEALRQNKDTWNHDASLLIAQLIAFKKGLNGRGEPKVGIPPGSIKDPMPNEVGSYLDQLSERYSKLISDAHKIIEEQATYSETRKKSVKEQTASYDPEILKLASWWGSRALTYINNSDINNWRWFSTDEGNNARMLMLKVSTDLIKQLKLIDNFVVSKDINAIPNAIYDFDKFISSFNKLLLPNIKKLVKLEDNANKNIKVSPKRIEEEVSSISPETIYDIAPDDNVTEKPEEPILELSGKKSEELNPKTILSDIVITGRLIQLMKILKVNDKDIELFDNGIKQLRKSLDDIVISGNGSLEDINNSYSDLKALSSKLFKIQDKSFSDQLKDVDKLIVSKAGMISPEFEKVAKNFLNRWLKRQKLKVLPDSDDRIRLDASHKILSLIDLVDAFQNSLEEKEPTLNVIKDRFLAIGAEIGELSDDLFYLGKTHNDEYEQNRLTGKPNTHLIKQEILSRLRNLKLNMADQLSKLI